MNGYAVWRLYDQTEVWTDIQGVSHQIEKMPTRYLRNARRFMEKHGPPVCRKAVFNMPPMVANGDMAQLAAEEAELAIMEDLWDWAESGMRTAPLYRAVCAELRDRRRFVRTHKMRHRADADVPTYREAVPF